MNSSPTDPLFQIPDFESGRAAAEERDRQRAADQRAAEADAASPPEQQPPLLSAADPVPHSPEEAAEEVPEEPAAPVPLAPLLVLRDGLPGIVDSPEALARAVAALGQASGPISLDAERASGYRYSARAYLIQVRREGSGTWLIDPVAFNSDLPTLREALGDAEWILHAATQDLPCLREVGLEPTSIFDSELAGRLLGYPRVGLATLVEVLLGQRMRKEHSSADWSTRPLPEPWLEYAALDVEVLLELREQIIDELAAQGKSEWARQEFEHLLSFTPNVKVDPWRKTSGVHKLKGRRSIAAVKTMWEARDQIATDRDVTPGRVVPDSAIIAAATALPTSRSALLNTRGFHGRGAERYVNRWLEALETAAGLPEEELPSKTARSDGPPQPRLWAERDPAAGVRWTVGRAGLADLSEQWTVPVENLLTPDHLRRVLWQPPHTRNTAELAAQIGDQLRGYGSREWQIELVTDPLVTAVLEADSAS